MSTVLCNSGPLIALGKLNRLDLLVALYGEVEIPRAVHDEVVSQELLLNEIAARPDIWIGSKLCSQVLASLRKSGT
jgi:predicted nucleic acid-binding protein